MSGKQKYTIRSASKRIERARGKVKGVGKTKNITCSMPGLKILGAIDFLVNHHHYYWVR